VRNGSGVNPLTLSASGVPRTGRNWSLSLDATGHAPATVVFEGRAGAATGPVVRAGELLIDLASPLFFRALVPHSGGPTGLTIAIPTDTALCGLSGHFQGAVLGAPGPELSNALDVTIGSP
jgi:hypothetical protein